MLARVVTFFLFAFFALCASAVVLPRTDQCTGGSVQCCNSLQEANSAPITQLAGLLGIVLGPVTGQVGLTCSPLKIIGIGGTSCSQQTVCCTGNNFSGLIVVGCSPINLSL